MNKPRQTHPFYVMCPRCKGRRVVFDPYSLMLTVALPLALLLDAGDDDGITKRRCPVCHGTGMVGMP